MQVIFFKITFEKSLPKAIKFQAIENEMLWLFDEKKE